MKFLLLLAFLILINSSALMAQTLREKAYRDTISIGLETVDWKYEEFSSDGSTFMKDSGQLSGFVFSYQRLSQSNVFYWKLFLRYVGGDTHYDGAYQNGDPVEFDTENHILWLGAEWGFPIFENELFFLAPHFGLTGRALENPKSDTEGDYGRGITYSYIPLGLTANFFLGQNMQLSLDATYNHFLGGTVETRLSDIGGSDFENKQEEGTGHELSATLSYFFNSWSMGLKTYYEYWDIEDSESVYSYGTNGNGDLVLYELKEPKNETKMLGFQLLFNF